jgi:hypothetical protein
MAALGLAALLLSAAVPGFAQKEKKNKEDLTVRTVQGTVSDPSGKAVGGAVVHLKNTKTLQIRSFITKDDGSYSFHGLSTSVDYELKAEAQGAASDVKTLSNFDSRNSAVINLKLNKK